MTERGDGEGVGMERERERDTVEKSREAYRECVKDK